MVGFAGYDMPVQYPSASWPSTTGRAKAPGCSNVSHMGQAYLVSGDGSHETVARALEALIPADIVNLAPGQQRYSQLLNEEGGILDDLMVTRHADPANAGALILVVTPPARSRTTPISRRACRPASS